MNKLNHYSVLSCSWFIVFYGKSESTDLPVLCIYDLNRKLNTRIVNPFSGLNFESYFAVSPTRRQGASFFIGMCSCKTRENTNAGVDINGHI